MQKITTIGLDIAKSVFQVHGLDGTGQVVVDGKRKGTYPKIQFDFLGYGFRPRLVRRSRDNTLFWGSNLPVSASTLKAMRAAIRELNLRHRTELPMNEIARQINPLLRG
jgi:RNA-directed DNA polymerase